MRVAALYDIHGNLPALEAVAAEVRLARVDRIVIGGDVLPGPMPRECLDLLLGSGIPTDFIIGNGDRETVAARHGKISDLVPETFQAAMEWRTAYPQAEGFATNSVLCPPSKQMMTAALSKAELS